MKIVFLDEYSVGDADISSIKALGEYVGYEITDSAEQIIRRAIDAPIIICNKVVMSREVMSQLPNLQLICVAATGMNNIDLDAARDLGIEVRNAIGYSTNSVAEATLSSALALLRQVSYYDRYIKSREYVASDRLFCLDRTIGQLRDSNWGVIGLGAIGREVARLASAFGCHISYFSTSGIVREEEYKQAQTLDELLATSDIISIHAPLNAQTEMLIGANELSKMRNNSILINVARGGIVDECALVEAINAGTIAGAALDVFSTEPIVSNSPIFAIQDQDRVVLSPHNAWQSRPAIDKLIAVIAHNIEKKIGSM